MKQICIDIIKKYPNYAERVNDKKAFNFLVGEVIKEVGKTANIKIIVAELKVLLNYTVPDKEKKNLSKLEYSIIDCIAHFEKEPDSKDIVKKLKHVLDKIRNNTVIDKTEDTGYYFILSNNPTLYCYTKDKTIDMWKVRKIYEEEHTIPETCYAFSYNSDITELNEDVLCCLKSIKKNLIVRN